ncbi:MAG: hypothetical protein KDC54_00700, partial [Lewinella sp.]|nr:hypothetical protein [Lewinella sp.]
MIQQRPSLLHYLIYSGFLLLGMTQWWACEMPATEETSTRQEVTFAPISVTYPPSPRDTTVVETICDKTIADPYRWLEDDHSEATGSWVRNQQRLAQSYFSQIPYRDAFARRLGELWDFARRGRPEYHGGYYYSFANTGQQNQDVLTRAATLRDSFATVIDPNAWTEGGTQAMGTYAFSQDGSKLAYQVAEAGSDWQNILVFDM